MDRQIGITVSINRPRGFFFILWNGRKVFCHASQWVDAYQLPNEYEIVSFDIAPASKPGHLIEAKNVRPAGAVQEVSNTNTSNFVAGIDTLAGAEAGER